MRKQKPTKTHHAGPNGITTCITAKKCPNQTTTWNLVTCYNCLKKKPRTILAKRTSRNLFHYKPERKTITPCDRGTKYVRTTTNWNEVSCKDCLTRKENQK